MKPPKKGGDTQQTHRHTDTRHPPMANYSPRRNLRTDGRTDGWMDGQMDGWTDTDGQTDGQKDRRTDKQTNPQGSSWSPVLYILNIFWRDGWTDRRTDGRLDRWMDRQMDPWKNTHKVALYLSCIIEMNQKIQWNLEKKNGQMDGCRDGHADGQTDRQTDWWMKSERFRQELSFARLALIFLIKGNLVRGKFQKHDF